MHSKIKIRGYILDIDGTLLNARENHILAWKRALNRYNIQKSEAEIIEQYGKPPNLIAEDLLKSIDESKAKAVVDLKVSLFMKDIKNISLFPRVTSILKEIHANNIPIVFASANYRRVIARMIEIFDWESLYEGYVGIEDVKNSKPDPEMIIKALNIINRPPGEVVTIGNSIEDILAAKAAGTKTIALCTELSEEKWIHYSPDLIVSSFADLEKYLPLEF